MPPPRSNRSPPASTRCSPAISSRARRWAITTDAKLPQVFRESFLLLFDEREPQIALRALDATISGVVWEGRSALETREGRAAPWLKREASGALGDLRQAIDSIADLGRWIDQAQLNRAESRLSLAAGDVAAELEPLTARLDAALAAYLATRQGAS